MNEIQVSDLLAQMRSLRLQAEGKPPEATGTASGIDFTGVLKKTIDAVNESQQQAGALAKALELGDKNVDLSQVMVAMQKANIAFQAMTHVRNKLVTAYQEIMSMSV